MNCIKKRAKFIFIIFCIWLIIILAYLSYFCIFARQEYIAKSDKMALRTKIIPASRGCLFDSKGIKLAWTERYYNLYLRLQNLTRKKKIKIYDKLIKIYPSLNKNLIIDSNGKILIKKCLTPNELKSSLTLLDNIPSLDIELRFTRHYINIPEIKEYIGTANFINGKWIGISGIEEKYNKFLNGEDGLYIVMLDKKGQWIEGINNTKKTMIPGNDFYLKESIDDIIKTLNSKR